VIVTCAHGHRYDDAQRDTGCPHYPIGAGAAVYCKTHDLFRPCGPCGERSAGVRPQSPADTERYPVPA
jgi:hypothetical protein